MTLSDSHKKKRINRVTSTTGADAIVNSEHLAARRILGIDELDNLPFDTPIYMLRGSYFEESICNLAEHLMRQGTDYLDPMPGLRLHKHPFRVHPELEWLGTSVDRLALIGEVTAGIVEAKSYLGDKREEFGEAGTDQVDERTFIQCVVHMAVLQLPWCRVPLDTGYDFRIYHIERDKELEDAVLTKLEAFYHRWIQPNIDKPIREMVLPEVDGLDSTTEWIKKRYKQNTEEILLPEQRHYEAALSYTELKQQFDLVKEKKDAVANIIRNEIGATGSAGWRDDLITMTWKQTKGKSYVDWRAIAEELGATSDLVAKHTREGAGFRRLYVKLKKGAEKALRGGTMQMKLLEGGNASEQDT